MTDEQAKENLITAFIPLAEAIHALATPNQTAILVEISALKDEIALLTQRLTSLEQAPETPTPEEPTDPIPEDPTPVDPEEPPVEEEPEPEIPPVEAPKDVLSTPYAITSGEWVNGVSTIVPRFISADTEILRKAFVVGSKVRFEDGDVRDITKSTVQYNKIFVELSGSKLNPAIHGHGKTFIVNPTTEYVPPVEPEDPETPSEPETPMEPEVPSPPVNGAGEMGIALGMGMGKPEVVPGEVRYDFELPVEADIDRAMSYGIRLFRVGSLRERLIMPGGNSELYLGTHTSQFGGQKPRSLPEIRNFCKLAASKGCKVMLDLFHNYGGFSETGNAKKDNNPGHKKIGTSPEASYDIFANDWKAIIEYLKADPEAWDGVYGLDCMNEWVGLPSDNVFYATQRFLDVCAPIMDDKLAVIEGNAYSNTPNFWDHNPRFKDLVDPRGPGFIEMSGHLYADADYSGMYKTGDTVRAGENFDTFYVNRVKPFLDGCDQYGFKANIGEWVTPGDLPKLLNGSRIGIEYALDRGCNVFVFGMGRGFSPNTSNHWNLEISRNIPTLNVVKELAARNKA